MTGQPQIMASAASFGALPLEYLTFGATGDPDAMQRARGLAGCLVRAADLATDGLFQDLARMREDDFDIAQDSWVLHLLPPRFAAHYTPLFVQQFIIAFADISAGITRGWVHPRCVAQELAVRILLDRTEDIAETFAINLPQGWRADLEEHLLEDLDHEYLYNPSADGFEDDPGSGPGGMAPIGFPEWFTAFRADEPLPPHLLAAPNTRSNLLLRQATRGSPAAGVGPAADAIPRSAGPIQPQDIPAGYMVHVRGEILLPACRRGVGRCAGRPVRRRSGIWTRRNLLTASRR